MAQKSKPAFLGSSTEGKSHPYKGSDSQSRVSSAAFGAEVHVKLIHYQHSSFASWLLTWDSPQLLTLQNFPALQLTLSNHWRQPWSPVQKSLSIAHNLTTEVVSFSGEFSGSLSEKSYSGLGAGWLHKATHPRRLESQGHLRWCCTGSSTGDSVGWWVVHETWLVQCYMHSSFNTFPLLNQKRLNVELQLTAFLNLV